MGNEINCACFNSLKALLENYSSVYERRLVSKDIFNNKPIVIYGAGKYGKIVYQYLTNAAKKSPICFADQAIINENSFINEIPVMTLSSIINKFGKDINIIITPKILYKNKEKLDQFLFQFHTIGLFNLYFINPAECDAWNMIYHISKDECLNIITMLRDNISKVHYYGYIRDVLQCESAENKFISDSEIYFPEDLFSITELDFLVDCGAYIGDTIVQIIRKYPRLRGVASFEPTPAFFDQLQSVTAGILLPIDFKLFNMAVGSKNGIVNMAIVPSRGANSIQREGNLSVQMCTLDDTVFRFHPTYIKMDIEGSELSALKGAAKIIRELTPILAICIYHKPEDLFEIPLFIINCLPTYSLFVRKYGNKPNNDLILYAVPPERLVLNN